MKKCAILVLDSLTGQTAAAARAVADGFAGTAEVFSLSAKAFTSRGSGGGAARAALSALAAADVVGFAAPTISYHAPPSTLRWLRESLPRECVANGGKLCFVLTTFGTHPGACIADIAAALRERGACVVAARAFRAPDSFAWFAPVSRKWPPGTAAKCRAFGAAVSIATTDISTRPTLLGAALARTPAQLPVMLLGPISVDESRCVRCGRGVAACPTGALTSGPGGVPQWHADRCIGCARCVAACPRAAIGAPCVDGTLLPPSTAAVLKQDIVEAASWVEWLLQAMRAVARFLRRGVFCRPQASLSAILAFLWALVGIGALQQRRH